MGFIIVLEPEEFDKFLVGLQSLQLDTSNIEELEIIEFIPNKGPGCPPQE